MNFLKNRWFSYLFNQETKLILCLVLFCLIITSYLGYLVPQLISELFKTYDNGEQFFLSLKNLGLLLIVEYFVRFLYQGLVNKYVQILIQLARIRCYSTWMHNYEGKKVNDEFPLGEILARIISDTESIRELLTSGSFGIFIDFIFIVSCLIGFLKLNLISGGLIFIAELLACVVLIYGSKYMSKIFILVRKSNGQVSRTLADITGGMNQMYYMKHNQYAQKRTLPVLEQFLKYQLEANLWDAGYFSVAESLFPILLCFLALIAPIAQLKELFLIAAIIDLIQRSINPIKDIAGKISSIQRAITGLNRISDFVDKLSFSGIKLKNDLNNTNLNKIERIEIDIPYYRYPVRQINEENTENEKEQKQFSLKNIKFSVNKGELVGIVGLSGSGKSSLMKILSLEIIPSQFKFKIDYSDHQTTEYGIDNEIKLMEYKSLVSLISQESHLFSSTLSFNLSLENELSESLVTFWEQMRKEIPYLNKWGSDLNTLISPKELSLGEKQLLSGLRAVYKNRPIALFDEISSALDSELEESLRKVILLVQNKSITFIVAHRVETLIHANKIIVMEQGEIKAIGTHPELINDNILYQKFISELSRHH